MSGVRDYSLTLTGVAQQLSTTIPVDPSRGGTRDEAFMQVIICADPGNSAAVFVGASSAVTSALFGFSLDPTQATAQDRQSIGPFANGGPVKLSDLWVNGTNNDKVHILAIPL